FSNLADGPLKVSVSLLSNPAVRTADRTKLFVGKCVTDAVSVRGKLVDELFRFEPHSHYGLSVLHVFHSVEKGILSCRVRSRRVSSCRVQSCLVTSRPVESGPCTV